MKITKNMKALKKEKITTAKTPINRTMMMNMMQENSFQSKAGRK